MKKPFDVGLNDLFWTLIIRGGSTPLVKMLQMFCQSNVRVEGADLFDLWLIPHVLS